MKTRIEQIFHDINRSNTMSLADKRTIKTALARQEVALGVAEAFVNANIDANQLISGGATWLTGLTFYVSPCVFVINGELYTSEASEVTLSDADGSNPRIDVIAVNKNGTAEVVEGTAAASPVKPEVDSDDQVEVTFVNIATGASAPTGVSDTVIYDEDDDWTTAVTSSNIIKADTSDPHAGTKAVKFNSATKGNAITFTAPAALSAADLDKITFYIKNINYGTNNNNNLRFALYNSTTRVSDWVVLSHGNYGFDGDNTSEWQFISIPISDFGSTGDDFDVLRILTSAAGNQSVSALIDDIKYQLGTPSTDLSQYAVLGSHNAFTKAQGTPIVTLTDAATVSWDAAPSNVYKLTLGGNRTIAAPTNVKPGFTYILQLYQDGDGSRTVTWNSVFKWAGGTAPTLSTGANAVDIISFVADSSGNLHGTLAIADSQ